MSLTVGQVAALATKSIESAGGVADLIFKNHAYLERLKKKEGSFTGTQKTFPFNYVDDTATTGSFYTGAEALSLDLYDPYSELAFELKEIQESLVISHLDLAKNTGKEARLNLLEQRLKSMEMAMRQRMVKGIFSDGTAATGALTTKQFVGMQAFLKSSSVNYGGVTDTDVPSHVATVSSNSGTLRALTTALIQSVIGGASEGENKPSLGIMRQNVADQFLELIKPHQRTTRDSNLSGLGHAGNTLVYSGIDHIVDNLAPATSIVYLNEEFVKLHSHPDYNMKVVGKEDLETMDAILKRLFYKGVYCCNVLRYQGWLKDITV
jgi:hypothetical protein